MLYVHNMSEAFHIVSDTWYVLSFSILCSYILFMKVDNLFITSDHFIHFFALVHDATSGARWRAYALAAMSWR